jgi:hypothetical protein
VSMSVGITPRHLDPNTEANASNKDGFEMSAELRRLKDSTSVDNNTSGGRRNNPQEEDNSHDHVAREERGRVEKNAAEQAAQRARVVANSSDMARRDQQARLLSESRSSGRISPPPRAPSVVRTSDGRAVVGDGAVKSIFLSAPSSPRPLLPPAVVPLRIIPAPAVYFTPDANNQAAQMAAAAMAAMPAETQEAEAQAALASPKPSVTPATPIIARLPEGAPRQTIPLSPAVPPAIRQAVERLYIQKAMGLSVPLREAPVVHFKPVQASSPLRIPQDNPDQTVFRPDIPVVHAPRGQQDNPPRGQQDHTLRASYDSVPRSPYNNAPQALNDQLPRAPQNQVPRSPQDKVTTEPGSLLPLPSLAEAVRALPASISPLSRPPVSAERIAPVRRL